MLAIVVSVEADELELASDRLWSLGVVAIEERSDAEGHIELWTSLGDDDSITAQLTAIGFPWRYVEVDERVADTWRDHAQPTWIDDALVIYPSWYEPWSTTAGLAAEVPPRVIAISIDPGATFGMGDHPTTVLSLRALHQVLAGATADMPRTVLDVGCGSGVLAIASCMIADVTATAIDISPASVPTTSANAERNGVRDRVAVSCAPLADVAGAFDVVVANILAPVLIDLADGLVRAVGDDGVLIISGILANRHQHVLDALAPLRQIDRQDLDGWTAITLSRPPR